MHTPDTPRGRETDRLMLLWRKQNPDAESSAYNREWDSVYRKLEGFSDAEIGEMASLNLRLEDGVFRYIVKDDGFHSLPAGIAAPPKPLRSYESERVAKRRAGTKGAFGKPKHLKRR